MIKRRNKNLRMRPKFYVDISELFVCKICSRKLLKLNRRLVSPIRQPAG